MYPPAGPARNQGGASSSRFAPARSGPGPALGQGGSSNTRQNAPRHPSQQEPAQQPIELSDEQREEIREAVSQVYSRPIPYTRRQLSPAALQMKFNIKYIKYIKETYKYTNS